MPFMWAVHQVHASARSRRHRFSLGAERASAPVSLVEAARDYYARGWVTIPLENDTEGRPKKPIPYDWTHTPLDWDAISALPWDRALGIGVVLGASSGNLGVIDIDDVELAESVWQKLEASGVGHYFVSTIRKRGHLYLIERVASPSTKRIIEYHGRPVTIELKSNGTQVAAPPTPGYALRSTEGPALVHDGLAGAWAALSTVLGLPVASGGQSFSRSGYPRAWAQNVTDGERNNSLFIEACKLAEAGMPLPSALETMQARIAVAYAGTMSALEVERTVRSAFRRAKKPLKGWM